MATSNSKMDCDYKDSGGVTAELNVNNNLNSNPLCLKASERPSETNNNEKCLLTEKSDALGPMNGIVEDKHTEDISNGAISLCTITNQINGDLTVGKNESECNLSSKTILQSPSSNELSSAEDGSLVENESDVNKLDKCAGSVTDSKSLVVDQVSVSDNDDTNEKIIACIGNLIETVSGESNNYSCTSVDTEKSSYSRSSAPDSNIQNDSDASNKTILLENDILESCLNTESNGEISHTESTCAGDSNLQIDSDTLKECISLENNVPESSLDSQSNNEISKTESFAPSSETVEEAFDESVSDDEVYVEVEEQESDLSIENFDEGLKDIDVESQDMREDVSDNLKTNDIVNESNGNEDVAMKSDFPEGENLHDNLSPEDEFEEIDSFTEKESVDLEPSDEKEDEPLSVNSLEMDCSMDIDGSDQLTETKIEISDNANEQLLTESTSEMFDSANEQSVSESISDTANEQLLTESKSEVSDCTNEQPITELKPAVSHSANDQPITELKPAVSHSANEQFLMEPKSEESNVLKELVESESKGNLHDIVMSEISDVKSVESNIAIEENSSKNIANMQSDENAKMNDPDDFVVLSDIEWSDDDDASDKLKTKEGDQNIEKNNSDQNTEKNNYNQNIETNFSAQNVEKNDSDQNVEKNDSDQNVEKNDSDQKVEKNDTVQKVKSDSTQNEKKCSEEKDTIEENPSTSSDGDDFDLDDVIEEFAKEEESKAVKLSDDELDDLVEEFVEAECSSSPAEENKESESKNLPSESDDEMELLIEDFKAVDSDNDCVIVQDSDNVVVINDDDDAQPRPKKSKLDDSQSCTDVTSSDNGTSISPEVVDKVSENETTVAQKNEVVSGETNTEKNKTIQIGSFKSEIFDSETEQANSSSVPEELPNKIESVGTVKDGISFESALPLPGKLPGKKVTLECRDDGIYLKKNQALQESGEERKAQINSVASDKISSLNDKIFVNQSSVNSTNSNSVEEERCMDDMLNKVCASGSNSNNNKECKSTAVETVSEMTNSSAHLEGKQIASERNDVKSLGSLCHDTLEESKKRKLEVLDIKSDEPQKKLKTEINGVETDIDTAESSTSRVEDSVRKKVLEHFKEAFPTKVQLKKSWLVKLSDRLCKESLFEEYKEEISQQQNIIKNLKDKLRALEDELYYSQSQASTFISVQQELFQKHQFTPQTAVRTVAVNVKIFRECDVPQPMPQPVACKTEIPTRTTEVHGSTPVSSTPPIKVQVPQQKIPATSVQQPAVPQTVASARFATNYSQSRSVTPSQRVVTAAPNVTMTKKEGPGYSNSQSYQPRSYLSPKSPHPQPPTRTYSNQVIDLTDEGSNKKLLPASSTLVSIASNSIPKYNLPGLQSNKNVLLPLNGVFQMVPAQTQRNTQFSLSNPVQVQQVSRQALVPNLPPNLLGPRTVAYIIPSNSGQISTIGQNSLPVSNFVPGTNQRLQTLFVRVTNPGQVTPMSTVITSSARMPVMNQSVRTPGHQSRNPSIPSTASDLVLFPRQPKHPAPFPALPEYRPNPMLKMLPPKPSLKGSKAPNGIILSWNMNVLTIHADISNYQLFAYQEAPGPVNSSLWKKVGDVKALPLPMACTLTQFVDGNRYYFTVRAVDVHNRFGPYSDAVSIMFTDVKDKSAFKV